MQTSPNMNQMGFNFDKFYERWILISGLIHLTGFIITYLNGSSVIWSLLCVITFGIYLFKIISVLPKLPFIYGYANWISILRLLIIITLLGIFPLLKDLQLFLFFLIAIILDGIDGFVARKLNSVTKQGGILDMEIDALMVLILTCIHVINFKISFWIVLPASFRYIYAWILYVHPLKSKKEMLPKIIRATIAVCFFLALLLPFVVNSLISDIIINISGVLIMLSFASSYLINKIRSRTK